MAETPNRATVWSEKCVARERLVAELSVGELSVGELAGRGTVRRETFRKSKTKYHIKIYFYKVLGVQVCLMVA